MAADTPKELYSVEEPDEGGRDAPPPSTERSDAIETREGGETREDRGAICPDCGAPLDPSDDICIRCGFSRDEERARVERQNRLKREAEAAAKRDADAVAHATPISTINRSPEFDFWMPVVLGSAALILLVVGHLAGAVGLFPQVRIDDTVVAAPWSTRLIELLRTLVLLLFWTGCGLAGLFMLALMFERPLGDARVAALRMASIVATTRLAAFITTPGPRWVEWMTESVLQAAGFVVLSMLLFRLAPRNAGILALWTLMAILLLWLFTYAVQWALAG